MAEQTQAADLGFDPDALRDKYRQERDKRLRADGNEQYVEIKDTYAHYLDDPYVKRFERDPLTDELDVLLIGGGFGGLLAGARLREAGVRDLRILEKGGDFGGTWYWNRYPGAQCDVESYVYLPLLEELDYVPKEKYSHAPEILAHSQAIGRHYDLYEDALFQTEVTGMRWDEDERRWIVSTNRGDALRARFVAMANGPLHRPKLPGIPGINDYEGHTFHTSRWDYAYTGGSAEGNLDRLHDKRVAIIGTGATAIQCVPHLGAAAEKLFVFSRTPSGVDERNNAPTDPEWAAALEAGWQKQRMENFNGLVSGVPQPVDLVDDGWTDLIGKTMRRLREGANSGGESGEGSDGEAGPGQSLREIMEAANFEKMNEIRARVDSVVEDPQAGEGLKPYYPMFCKRPCFHDEYLATFNRSNVELIDTDGQGVERVTKKGIVVAGVEYEVDCLIFATGFEVGTGYARRAGYEIVGRDGVTLTEKWADGMATLHGIQSRGFPNCFIMGSQQGGFAVNYPHLLNEVAVHQAHIIGHALDKRIEKVEVSAAAEDAWVEEIIEKSVNVIGAIGGPGCTPGYYNNEGKPAERASAQNGPYGAGPNAYFQVIADWRDAGDLEGLELTGK